VIVYVVPVINCSASLKHGMWHNAGGVLGGALGQR